MQLLFLSIHRYRSSWWWYKWRQPFGIKLRVILQRGIPRSKSCVSTLKWILHHRMQRLCCCILWCSDRHFGDNSMLLGPIKTRHALVFNRSLSRRMHYLILIHVNLYCKFVRIGKCFYGNEMKKIETIGLTLSFILSLGLPSCECAVLGVAFCMVLLAP